MLEKFNELKPKPQNVAELRTALLTIRDDLLNETVRKSVLRFRKRLGACVKAEGGNVAKLNTFTKYCVLNKQGKLGLKSIALQRYRDFRVGTFYSDSPCTLSYKPDP